MLLIAYYISLVDGTIRYGNRTIRPNSLGYQELKYHSKYSLELNVFFLQIPVFLEFASLF